MPQNAPQMIIFAYFPKIISAARAGHKGCAPTGAQSAATRRSAPTSWTQPYDVARERRRVNTKTGLHFPLRPFKQMPRGGTRSLLKLNGPVDTPQAMLIYFSRSYSPPNTQNDLCCFFCPTISGVFWRFLPCFGIPLSCHWSQLSFEPLTTF